MAEAGTSSIMINAAKSQIMDVIADFGSYPLWAGFIKKAEVVDPGDDGRARQVRFSLDAGVLKDEYTLQYDWSGDDRVSWSLVQGRLQKAQNGTYTLEEEEGATRVTYHLEVEINMPMLGMMKRKAEKVIMDTALKELKKRVEG